MAKHDKFKAYWESLSKPQIEYLWDDDDFEPVAGVPAWAENTEYRIAGDRHWELRREWVNSDFTLPIESCGEGEWFLCKNPCWMGNSEYRKAKTFVGADSADGRDKTVAWKRKPVNAKPGEWVDGEDKTVAWKRKPVNAKPGEWVDGEDKTVAWVHQLKNNKPGEAVEVPPRDFEAALPYQRDSPADECGVNHPLYAIFMDAIEQATGGKGVRHGGAATPFFEQPWNCIAKHTGFRGLIFQMVKKTQEACGKDDMETFERELLGSLVYGAMALIHARKHGYTKQVKV
jgi:hypothetical protein